MRAFSDLVAACPGSLAACPRSLAACPRSLAARAGLLAVRAGLIAGCAGLLAGCAGSPPTTVERSVACKPGDPATDAAVFDRLTANRWGNCGSNVGLCLTLAASGDYTTSEGFEDYVIEGDGRWSFYARDATSGLVCFDDGTITSFALTADGLLWKTHGVLAARDALPGGGTRDALDVIDAPALFDVVTHNPWRRANDLDLFYQPTSFAIARDGSWQAAWRDGACTAAGTFSITADRTSAGGAHETLRPHPEPNVCDTRGGGMTASLPGIDDYGDAAQLGDEQHLAFSSYGPSDGLFVRASWSQPLHSDAPKTWTVSLANVSPRTQSVSSIEIAVTPIAAEANGFSTTGPTTTLFQQAFAETIAPEATFATTAALALPAAGLYSLRVDVASVDSQQTWRNTQSYVLELTP